MTRLLILVALWAGAASAQDIRDKALISQITVGIVCAPEVLDHAPAPGTVAGVTNIIDSLPPFVSNDRTVPAVIGIGFAVSATATIDLPEVTIDVTHPPMGPEGAVSQTYPSAIFTDGTSFAMYQFEYDYELVEGPWTFSARLGDQQLWQVSFNVVPPEMIPGLAVPCGYEDLLS